MAKYYGLIGFAQTDESAPGVYTEYISENNYSGDVIDAYKRWQNSENLNNNITVSNTKISIVADNFAIGNFTNIRYVTWLGVKWKVTNVQISRPRLILTLGEVYND